MRTGTSWVFRLKRTSPLSSPPQAGGYPGGGFYDQILVGLMLLSVFMLGVFLTYLLLHSIDC